MNVKNLEITLLPAQKDELPVPIFRWDLSPTLLAFLAATIGYSLYYVCRLSLSVMKGPLVEEGLLTEFQLGLVGSALFYTLAAGKLVNGFLADRVDIRKFAATGLLISAAINLGLGFHVGFYALFALWMINGWCQSMGAGSFITGLTRLFDVQVRGTYYGIWSSSHNIGEALSFLLVSFAVAHAGWRFGWWTAGMLGLTGAAVIWLFFRTDAARGERAPAVSASVAKAAQIRLLKNPTVWLIALASMLMYISRYSINSWGIFFLEKAKGYPIEKASLIVSVSAVCGIVGTVSSGWISDRFFRGDRAVPTIFAGVLNVLALIVFLMAPAHFVALSMASMAVFGVTIGALLCYLGGLMAVDIAGNGAAGAAVGIVGMASYAGAGTQDVISGFLIGAHKVTLSGQSTYDFLPVSLFWIGSSLLCVLVSVAAWWSNRRAS